MEVKGASGEISDGNEEYLIGNWRKGDPCYKWQTTWLNCVLMLGGKYNF